MRIDQLEPGDRFIGYGETGTVELVNECRVRVKFDGPGKVRQFETVDGERVSFTASGDTVASVSPSYEVERVPANGRE